MCGCVGLGGAMASSAGRVRVVPHFLRRIAEVERECLGQHQSELLDGVIPRGGGEVAVAEELACPVTLPVDVGRGEDSSRAFRSEDAGEHPARVGVGRRDA